MKRRTRVALSLSMVAAFGACSSRHASRVSTPPGEGAPADVRQISMLSERLSSGYRVVLARTPRPGGRDSAIYIGSYVVHGSIDESRPGWAHLMEHVVANNPSVVGGPPRPENLKLIQSNALTRPYYTSFVSVVPPALLSAILHTRMARAGRAADDAQVFTAQVQRVLAELERDMSGQYPAYKALVALSLDRSPKLADELVTVRETNQQELKAAIAQIYTPRNAVLVIAGDIDLERTRALVHETEARLRLTEVRGGEVQPARNPELRTGKAVVLSDQNRGAHTVIGVGWVKPPLGHPDQLPLLVADQLLLGRSGPIDDPARSDASPMAIRLTRSLGGAEFWDGRAGTWGAPDMVDIGPASYALLFNTDRDVTVDQVAKSVQDALRDIRRNALSDADIEAAKQSLARFYEQWLLEPTHRVLADHLMAWSVTGRNPEQVKHLPAAIRHVQTSAVRRAFDRYLLDVQPNVVVLLPGKS